MSEEEIKGLDIWIPEKGEEITGEVTKINTEGQFGIQATLRLADGKELDTPSHAWLQRCLKKVAVGDKIKVRYEGEEPPKVKGHSPTRKYYVAKVK